MVARVITDKGREVLEALRGLRAKTRGDRDARREEVAQRWAEDRAKSLIKQLREHGNLQEDILLLSVPNRSYSSTTKLRISHLSALLGINLINSTRFTNMGGGDPRESDDWYVSINTQTLLKLLEAGS